MSEWLTGTQVENIRSYFDPENESADICEVANGLLDDRKRLVGLLKVFVGGQADFCKGCGADLWLFEEPLPNSQVNHTADCAWVDACACLTAQEE